MTANPETRGPERLRICGVTESNDIWSLISSAVLAPEPGGPEPARDLYRTASLREVLNDTGSPPDLLLADLTGPFDDGVAASQQGRTLLARQPSIVLCPPAQQLIMRNLAMEGVIIDFYPVGGTLNDHYFQWEIWRAMRHVCQQARTARPTRPGTAGAFDFSGLRALIVEDDLASRTLICDYLETVGFTCTVAPSVAAACLHHRDGDFDVILMDLYMPGVSGSRAVRTIREHFTPHDLPIVVTSAYSDVGLVRACIKEGISAYLVKPLRKAVVLDRLRSILL